MNFNILPLFRSHYSLGRSILTLEKPTGKEDSYPTSIFDLLINNKINTLTLVEDNVSGLLQASKNCEDNKIKLIFGLRLKVTDDIENQTEESLSKRATYIVFAKNSSAYQALISIWKCASQKGFYYTPCIDFKHLKKLWNKNLILSVPFYDSFLYKNHFCAHSHVPDLDSFKPVTFFIENNDLPFDSLLEKRVKKFCETNKYEILSAQSIFYKTADDFIPYLAFRCIHSPMKHKKTGLDKPELEHMGSETFSFERWKKLNES